MSAVMSPFHWNIFWVFSDLTDIRQNYFCVDSLKVLLIEISLDTIFNFLKEITTCFKVVSFS